MRRIRAWSALALVVLCAAPVVVAAPSSYTAFGRSIDASPPAVRESLRRFYPGAIPAPAWLDGATPRKQALEIVAILHDAPSHGLDPRDYGAARLGQRLRALGPTSSPRELADLDVALTAALFRYLGDVHVGRIDPRAAHFHIDLARKRQDLAAIVREALATDRLREAAAAAAPRFPMYAQLRDALARYRALAATPWPELPAVKKLEPGEAHAALPALAARLAALGDLPAATPVPARYEGALVDAVERFQSRHGLEIDGIVGRATLAALDVSPAARVRQIELALERLRWLPAVSAPRVIGVNIPEFRLWAFDFSEGTARTRLRIDVIVGRALESRTPVFVEDMRYIEFQPYWNVPASIARDEIVPRLRRDPAYLEREQMEFVPVNGDGMPATAVTPEALAAVERGAQRIRQRPGDRNALGDIKFVLPNNMNIYLHHTPSVQLFRRSRRDFSHGCIRVEEPVALAKFVLEDDPAWTEGRIRAAMTMDKPSTVRLPRPVPVVIFYTTVIVEDDGRVLFLPDIYEHDRTLDAALRARSGR